MFRKINFFHQRTFLGSIEQFRTKISFLTSYKVTMQMAPPFCLILRPESFCLRQTVSTNSWYRNMSHSTEYYHRNVRHYSEGESIRTWHFITFLQMSWELQKKQNLFSDMRLRDEILMQSIKRNYIGSIKLDCSIFSQL